METKKPTKEELSNHYQFNRKYFDEIAKYYYENDKEYYTIFIKPFFNQPVQTVNKKKGISPIGLIISVVGLITANLGIYYLPQTTGAIGLAPIIIGVILIPVGIMIKRK